jgi:hypothetical protein
LGGLFLEKALGLLDLWFFCSASVLLGQQLGWRSRPSFDSRSSPCWERKLLGQSLGLLEQALGEREA